jgi:hypothetical protein
MCDSQASQQDNEQSNSISDEESEGAVILHNLSEIKKLVGIMNNSLNTIVEHIDEQKREDLEAEIFAHRACKDAIEYVIKGVAFTLCKLPYKFPSELDKYKF